MSDRHNPEEPEMELVVSALYTKLERIDDTVGDFLANGQFHATVDELLKQHPFQIENSFARMLKGPFLDSALPRTVEELDALLDKSKETIAEELSIILARPRPIEANGSDEPAFTALQNLYDQLCDHFRQSVTRAANRGREL